MKDCVFCKIVSEEIPRDTQLETENLVVFKDIKPKAPVHLLIVPKKHVENISGIDDTIWVEIKNAALELAKKFNTSGFRLVNNSGDAQEVKHMHVHFLGEVGVDREL